MKLTAAHRRRLAEIVRWRPTGSRPLHPIFADDAIDRLLIEAELIRIDAVRIRLPGDRQVTNHHWCIATAEGEAEIRSARPRRSAPR